MIKKIQITTELRDYIERLNYEEIRYKDLLQCVTRDSCPMTDEEWDSSYNYYSELYEEARISKKFALDEVANIYKDDIQNNLWYVDFGDCSIIIGKSHGGPSHEKDEQYNDYLNRLFPKIDNESMHINGSHVKDITLQVTDACNMACTYCYQHDKNNHSMSFDTAKKFLDMILNADELTNSYITSTKSAGATIQFIGGEPWLEVELITKVSDYFIGELFRRKHPWAIKFLFGVCSNGLLHFDLKVQSYIAKHCNHLSYNISIDGNKDLHDTCRVDLGGNGTYDRAIEAVWDYRNTFKGVMGSKMTIAPGNVSKIYDAVTYMISENNYKHINLNCVYEEGWTNEHANILYWELHKITDWIFEWNLQDKVTLSMFTEYCGKPHAEDDNQNWCGGLGLMIAVDYKGDIYPCLRYMETSSNKNIPPYIIGDIENGINIKKEHCERVDCMNCITRRSQSTDECFNCPISMGCGWCSAYNYEVFGTPNKRATYICCMHKARVLANVYYWRRMGVDFPMNCPKDWAIEIIGEDEYDKLNAMEVVQNGTSIIRSNCRS